MQSKRVKIFASFVMWISHQTNEMKLGQTTTVKESETRSFMALHVTMDSTCKSKRKDTTFEKRRKQVISLGNLK